jgi:hypothetical protein
MHVSSRWCVTAVFALGALSCSDPVAPPAQGAFIATINNPSPAQPGKACPIGASFSFDVPEVRIATPAEVLDRDTYLHKIVDGESGASARCSVKSSGGGFAFSGTLSTGVKSLDISSGTLGPDMKGTARVTLANTKDLSSPLAAQGATCIITAAESGTSYQVKGGSMWASFSCTALDAPPSQQCAAEGIFVLENCDQ